MVAPRDEGEGTRLLERSASGEVITEYHVEAGIAGLHAAAGNARERGDSRRFAQSRAPAASPPTLSIPLCWANSSSEVVERRSPESISRGLVGSQGTTGSAGSSTNASTNATGKRSRDPR
jgi:hypothetical protein